MAPDRTALVMSYVSVIPKARAAVSEFIEGSWWRAPFNANALPDRAGHRWRFT